MVFGKVNYLNSMDTRQYLYCLSPKPEVLKELKVLKGVTNIGKLDIVWKTNMGERGRLQTSQLQRVVCIIMYCYSCTLNISPDFYSKDILDHGKITLANTENVLCNAIIYLTLKMYVVMISIYSISYSAF